MRDVPEDGAIGNKDPPAEQEEVILLREARLDCLRSASQCTGCARIHCKGIAGQTEPIRDSTDFSGGTQSRTREQIT